MLHIKFSQYELKLSYDAFERWAQRIKNCYVVFGAIIIVIVSKVMNHYYHGVNCIKVYRIKYFL